MSYKLYNRNGFLLQLSPYIGIVVTEVGDGCNMGFSSSEVPHPSSLTNA